MNYPLYIKNHNYYLITNKGINYNIALEFTTYTNKIISNDELIELKLIEFNQDNIKILMKNFIMDLSDFDDYHLIKIHNNIYKINNWLDVFNLCARF